MLYVNVVFEYVQLKILKRTRKIKKGAKNKAFDLNFDSIFSKKKNRIWRFFFSCEQIYCFVREIFYWNVRPKKYSSTRIATTHRGPLKYNALSFLVGFFSRFSKNPIYYVIFTLFKCFDVSSI